MGKTVSGVLGVRLGEAPAEPEPEQAPPPAAEVPAAAADPSPPTPQEPDVTEPTALAEPAPAPEQPRPVDAVLAAAVDLAREAAVEVGGSAVGEHLGAETDGPEDGGPAATHAFATTDPAYVGWRWAVTVARSEGSEHVTVDEVVLLPGAGALLAPAWVPWSERVRPGDLGPGDLMPPPPDDPRLAPSYASPDADDPLVAALRTELGLGRPRVLSREGRLDAAERWEDGDAGPDTPLARQAPGRCGGCGFLVPLAGALGAAFGACANAVAPDDGRVVALTHGCGAHSETVVEAAHAATAGMAVQEEELELVEVRGEAPVEVPGQA